MYAKEALAQVEQVLGCLKAKLTLLPVTDYHPESDTSLLLDVAGHQKSQMLIGMLQWLVTIVSPDLYHALASLN